VKDMTELHVVDFLTAAGLQREEPALGNRHAPRI
jgi:hypothetical protein